MEDDLLDAAREVALERPANWLMEGSEAGEKVKARDRLLLDFHRERPPESLAPMRPKGDSAPFKLWCFLGCSAMV
jgi:hypothetical protein